jgi:hypothetical protein
VSPVEFRRSQFGDGVPTGVSRSVNARTAPNEGESTFCESGSKTSMPATVSAEEGEERIGSAIGSDRTGLIVRR